MKKIVLVLLIGLCSQTFAQSKFSIGVTLSPDMNGLSASYFKDKSEGKLYYKNGLGYQIGVKTRWDLNGFFTIQTGVSSVVQQHKTSKFKAIQYVPYTSSTEDPEYIEFEIVNKSIQVPVIFSFYFGEKWKVGLSTGFAYNYSYATNSIVWEYYQSKTVETRYKFDTRYSTISGMVGVGLERSINQLTFRLEPTYGMPIFNLNSFEFYEDNKWWSAGLNLSAYYKF